MMEAFFTYAPVIGLIFFFSVFLGIIIWALRPANKTRFQGYSAIPLDEDFHGKK